MNGILRVRSDWPGMAAMWPALSGPRLIAPQMSSIGISKEILVCFQPVKNLLSTPKIRWINEQNCKVFNNNITKQSEAEYKN